MMTIRRRYRFASQIPILRCLKWSGQTQLKTVLSACRKRSTLFVFHAVTDAYAIVAFQLSRNKENAQFVDKKLLRLSKPTVFEMKYVFLI